LKAGLKALANPSLKKNKGLKNKSKFEKNNKLNSNSKFEKNSKLNSNLKFEKNSKLKHDSKLKKNLKLRFKNFLSLNLESKKFLNFKGAITDNHFIFSINCLKLNLLLINTLRNFFYLGFSTKNLIQKYINAFLYYYFLYFTLSFFYAFFYFFIKFVFYGGLLFFRNLVLIYTYFNKNIIEFHDYVNFCYMDTFVFKNVNRFFFLPELKLNTLLDFKKYNYNLSKDFVYDKLRLSKYSVILKKKTFIDYFYHNSILHGYKIRMAGRFSRKRKRSIVWIKKGINPITAHDRVVDYGDYITSNRYSTYSVRI
jgi:hypothetical protein